MDVWLRRIDWVQFKQILNAEENLMWAALVIMAMVGIVILFLMAMS